MTGEEIQVAKQSMEQYILFMQTSGLKTQVKDFYCGAAAGINDLLCRLGYGHEVAELAEALEKNVDPMMEP